MFDRLRLVCVLPFWGLLFLCSGTDALGTPLWFANENRVFQLAPDTAVVTPVLSLSGIKAMANDVERGDVWVLTSSQLRRLDTHGNVLASYSVSTWGISEAKRLQLDPYDGSVWVSGANVLVHLTSSGALLGRWKAPSEIKRLTLAQDQSVWVLGPSHLYRITPQCVADITQSLGTQLGGEEARRIEIDSLGNRLWVSSESKLLRLDLAALTQPGQLISFSNEIEDLALQPISGELWVATSEGFTRLSRDGVPLGNTPATTLNLHEVEGLEFDSANEGFWLWSDSALLRLAADGTVAARYALATEVEALAAAPFKLVPSVGIILPPANALTNNPLPPFSLQYGTICALADCQPPVTYFQGLNLNAMLNGQSITGFQFEPANLRANFIPTVRLPEGANSLQAMVQDAFGHSSNLASVNFTVDTIPPVFTNVTPADGSVVASPTLLIQGSVDDPTASVVLENLANWNGQGANPATQTFSYTITLKPGLNTFKLTAVDRAGNIATKTLNVTYVASNITLTISAPLDGAAIQGNQVLVSGTYQGPANTGITVNGVLAVTDGARFNAVVPLQPGQNTITARGATAEGGSAQQVVTVIANTSATFDVSADRTTGIAPATVSFYVNDIAGIGVQEIKADFNGDGAIDLVTNNATTPLQYVYDRPGIYTAIFNIKDSQGSTQVISRTIIVEDVTAIDARVRGVFATLLERLNAGDVDGALTQVAPVSQAKFYDVFMALKPALPQVVASLGTLQAGWFTEEIAEYPVFRQQTNGTQVFLVYFIRGKDGVWRIEDM